MKPRKILILTADVAGGHMATAKALQTAWLQKSSNDRVEIIDLFEELDIAPFNTSESSYNLFTQNFTLRAINNFVFRAFNTGVGYDLWKAYVNWRLYYATLKFVCEYQPDLIICNHPIVATVISEVKSKVGGFKYVVSAVDIGTMWKAWADQEADLIISPAASATDQLIRHGAPSEIIASELWPLRTSLSDTKDRAILLEEYNLNPEQPIIMITGGGIGVTAINHVLHEIQHHTEWQVLVLCGKQESTRKMLSQKYILNKHIKILGFTDRMQDLYILADVVIAKAGPNTILELLAFNKKAILTKEIGQQEIGNITYAVSQSNLIQPMTNGIVNQIEGLIKLTGDHQQPRRNLNEVYEIVDRCLRLIS